MTDSFWDLFGGGMSRYGGSTISEFLTDGTTSKFKSVQALTGKAIEKSALEDSLLSGTRVAFKGGNLGVLLSYSEPPRNGQTGTVIKVRTAAGDTTSFEDHVFVKWDHGPTFLTARQHLARVPSTEKTASSYRMRVSNIGDISEFFSASTLFTKSSDLVHKSTKDLWAVHEDDDGFVIERLFKDDGTPLKV